MAVTTNDLVEIEVHYTYYNQIFMNVFQYQITGTPGPVDMSDLLPAYWNHVKAVYRALSAIGLGAVFQKIVGRELNAPTGDLAEFGIPEGEQTGTRITPSPADALPPFNSTGIRFMVSTRATRPGQKRVPFLYEVDNLNASLTPTFTGLLVNWANLMTSALTLGAPSALTVLQPIVTRKNPTGLVTAFQPVTGYLINPLITSQNSRKIGRGM